MTEYRPLLPRLHSGYRREASPRSFWAARLLRSNRIVLGLALAIALGLPELVHAALAGFGPWFAIRYPAMLIEPSMLVVGMAISAGHLTLQQTGVLPLVTTRNLILPTFLTTFGTMLILLFAVKLQVARFHIWTGFALAVAWYYVVGMMRNRLIRPVIGIIGIPKQFFAELPNTGIIWYDLQTPRLPRRVEAVVVDPHADLDLAWSHFITSLVLEGTPVYHRSHIEEALTGKVHFQSHADNNFGALLPSSLYIRAKYWIDLAFAILVLPFVALVVALCAIAVRLESKGEAFFVQERIGYRGKPFRCYKLRTMRSGAAGPSFTLASDPRITRLGAFLRKFRLDELPQILNVIKGEMSWIGPRPEAVDLAHRYSANVPFYDYRHAVRPGISGWAAVHQGNVGDIVAAKEKLGYDFYYIKYFSVWLDFVILIKTVRTIFSGFGAR